MHFIIHTVQIYVSKSTHILGPCTRDKLEKIYLVEIFRIVLIIRNTLCMKQMKVALILHFLSMSLLMEV